MWQCAIEDNVFWGREISDFLDFLYVLSQYTGYDVIKIIYIHNSGFEFQFLRNIFKSIEIFARTTLHPMYFRWRDYEFRCSYMLTRLSLDSWGKKCGLKKLTNTIDYTISRTPKTPLTKKVIDYAITDVRVMVKGLHEYKTRYGTVENIPLTQTGIVRREFNNRMRGETRYQKKMSKLQPLNPDLYKIFTKVLAGGYTHANYINSGIVCSDVKSKDYTSAYPWNMIDKKYPMTPFTLTKTDLSYLNGDRYSVIMYVEFYGVNSKSFNNYISKSKVDEIKNGLYDNGRVISADFIGMYLTNVDYDIIVKAYNIYNIDIKFMYVSLNGYLSPILQKYILELFVYKTTLKGVDEEMYLKSKEELNALFGMACTRIITDDITYKDNEWGKDILTDARYYEKAMRIKRNLSKCNTAFQHGIYVPAYTRRELWDAILTIDSDDIYNDTDSIKYMGDYEWYFEQYNANIRKRQEIHAERLGVDISMFRPVSPKGKVSSLGEFADDGEYWLFKTLGAKKYIYVDETGMHMTVSGVRKQAVYQLDKIEDFTDGVVFNVDNSKKLLLHYNDNQPEIVINKGMSDEYKLKYKYGICAQPTTYTIGLTQEYGDLLKMSMMRKGVTLMFEGEKEDGEEEIEADLL